MAHLEKEINSLLLALVSFDTQVAEKRDAMLTGLARRAAQGAADIKGTQFLAEYGLDSVPLTGWQTLRGRSRAHLEGELRRRGYEPCDDVREDSAEDAMARWHRHLDSYRCHGGPVQHPPFAAELAAFLEGFVRDSRH